MSMLAAIAGAQAALNSLSERIRRSTVELRAGPRQLGAGIAWGEDLVLTNAHVATGSRLEVTNHRGETRQGTLLARDPARDLALLARVRESYLRQAAAGGWIRLDADRDREAVAAEVFAAVMASAG